MWHRQFIILLCALLLFAALIPVTAHAGNVTISTYDSYNYFVTFSSQGVWTGLKAPFHSIVETGAVAYCIQPSMDSPNNSGYTEGMGWSTYDETTRLGIQAILENGYPNYDGGFMPGEARYATANALRFWVAERGCDGALDWMDLTRFSEFFRGASGYEDLFDWCMHLLNCARTGSVIEYSASLSTPNVSEDGDYFVISTTVTLENCNWGYTYDETTMPPGTEVYGYSGYSGDNLTIYVSKEYAGYDFDICISAEDNRTPASVVYYGPDSANMQRLVSYTLNYSSVVAEASKTVSLEASVSEDMGMVRFIKTDSVTGEPIENVGFWIYGPNGFSSNWTDANGIVEFTFEPGSYSYREGDPPDGYVVDDSRYYFTITAGEVTEIYVENTPLPQNNAVIEITKTDENGAALSGAEVALYGSSQSLISSVTTSSDGKAIFSELSTGTYFYKELSAPSGYVLDETLYEIEIDTAGETVTATLKNTKAKGSLLITKTDEDTGAALNGVEFTLYDSSKNELSSGTTGENGKLTFTDISIGSYYYRETQAKGGYIGNDEYYQFTISEDGESVSVEVKNKTRPGTIYVTKSDSDGTPLSGAEYTLESSSDGGTSWSEHGRVTTDGSGKGSFTVLIADMNIIYRLTETKAPEGFSLITDSVFVGSLPVEVDSDAKLEDSLDINGTKYCYSVHVNVTDCPVFRLPDTGGSGGLLLIFALLASYLISLTMLVHGRALKKEY